ncbi:hypothetical protein D3Z36_02720 [Lachnospiraceae bacterium]|nr:hypothetical protein [Lachnospiraceae bacterium]
MSITSFYFLVFITIGVAFYYVLPKKIQWVVLLLLSLVFYYFAAVPYTIGYLAASTLIAYFSTLWMKRKREKQNQDAKVLPVTMIALLINIAIWFVVKGRDLWFPFASGFMARHDVLQIDAEINLRMIASLGMGYYTLQIMGYIIDCYWQNAVPQKNPLKLFLFVSYFPQLTTGPISRYAQLETLYERHKFEYQNISFGAQRILWGFTKKIVLAERIGIIVSALNSDMSTYTGFYSWIAILLYPLQMYADFSGCMDIVLGVSELFGIRLAENFHNPFFARTSQEFWQRWHITLGTWAKDYVLYPLLKSKRMIRFGKFTRKKFGKKAGKFLVNMAGMFILWMVMGIWHGGLRYIAGVSLWYWVILMLGDLFAPVFLKITNKLEMKTDSFAWHFFQSGRTYLIYAVGATFFSVGVTDGIYRLKDALKVLCVKNYANPWIFFDQSILNLGVTWGDINLIIFVSVIVLLVAILREKHGYARIWVQQQCFIFRWMIWISLFIIVLIWGKYGPGYDASIFIYEGF